MEKGNKMSKSITPAQAIKQDLAKMKQQFASALPNHIPVEKFIRTMQTAISTSPQLVSADRQSLFAAAMKAAQDGLLPDGKEAAIVTFKSNGKDVASYMPMVGGILKKVRNSGELSTITSQIVYSNDEFSFFINEDGEQLMHKPDMFADRGEAIGVYALAKTKDGAVYIEVMTRAQVDAVKNVSRGKNGPWSGPFAMEMWRKTAIKRLSKRLPMSTDIEFTMRADDELYDIEKPEIAEVEVDEVQTIKDVDQTKPNNLSAMIKKTEPVNVEELPI